MDPEGFGGQRHLSDLLSTPRLRSQCGRGLEQLPAISGGGGEGKAREQNTDDH
jgi:hypothetical protein